MSIFYTWKEEGYPYYITDLGLIFSYYSTISAVYTETYSWVVFVLRFIIKLLFSELLFILSDAFLLIGVLPLGDFIF